ncbi:hypothetical protein SAMN05446635_8223 [Burkholderia sp. OK233]|nr:hypothetical protein SAMN05446635_8223 [Burkholderia sp. OK233]
MPLVFFPICIDRLHGTALEDSVNRFRLHLSLP